MTWRSLLRDQLRITRRFGVQFVSIVVGAHGMFILATTLLDQLAVRHGSRLTAIVVDIPLLIGLSLLYLSTLLRRRKRTAWLITIVAYSFYLGIGAASLLGAMSIHNDVGLLDVIRRIVLPTAILALLLVFREAFVVQSDIQGFRWAARFSLIMLFVAMIYGTVGFSLLDNSDFHQEIAVPTALHYTLDQFDLTTAHPIHPYTKRARLFIGSLSFVSIGAVAYMAISIFQPLRLRLSDQTANRRRLADLLANWHGRSEDFFKLWPHDKQYFFDSEQRSGLAFHVYHGVALCLGDPVGDKRRFPRLLDDFTAMCFGNDWTPAFIHVEGVHRKLYERRGLSLQRIGQEAVLDLEPFQATATNKYFRHINNKFRKQGFTCELLRPPHHAAVLDRLAVISQGWRQSGGHVERGFAMGYYSTEYMQLCPIMVTRDAAGTIQAFVNQLPAGFDRVEANFDLLRHTKDSPGNINDFLLMNFCEELRVQGYQRLNLGLCPLTGLDEDDDDRGTVIDNILRFAYANGDRFYSFSGLYRFKAKYEPEWRDRYIAYEGGIRGFTRTTNALMRTMRVSSHGTTQRRRRR